MVLLIGGLALLGGGCAGPTYPLGRHYSLDCRTESQEYYARQYPNFPTSLPGVNFGTDRQAITYGAACDNDKFRQPVKIRLYAVDRQLTLQEARKLPDEKYFFAEVLADQRAPDQRAENEVKRYCGGTTHHGFYFQFPESFSDGVLRHVYAYAVNAKNPRRYARLQESPQTFVCSYNDAAVVGSDVPSVVDPGQTFSANITMKNTGTRGWLMNGAHYQIRRPPFTTQPLHQPYYLGSENPRRNTRWGLAYVEIPPFTYTKLSELQAWIRQLTYIVVRPQETYTFSFSGRAPATPGVYAFDWSMISRGGPTYFGKIFQKNIQVGSGTPPPPPPPPPGPPLTPGLIL
ncbi:MAG: hypothetical protein G01um1014106_80, partial [Parcubacteria group bacterium Gr01-1014_106]